MLPLEKNRLWQFKLEKEGKETCQKQIFHMQNDTQAEKTFAENMCINFVE